MAIDLVALATELQTDPQGLGYTGDPINDHSVINLVRASIQIDVPTVPTRDIIEATIASEYSTLSDTEKSRYQTLVSVGEIDPNATNAVAAFQAMFTGGTTTRSNLLALQSRDGSRAEQLFEESVSLSRIREVLLNG
jgi:hypothetical protein